MYPIIPLLSCTWAPEDAEPPLNCFYKRNCVELDGMYSCTDGYCSSYIMWRQTLFLPSYFRLANWKCERACRDIPTSRQNVISMAGDKIVSAHCRVGINSRLGKFFLSLSLYMTISELVRKSGSSQITQTPSWSLPAPQWRWCRMGSWWGARTASMEQTCQIHS